MISVVENHGVGYNNTDQGIRHHLMSRSSFHGSEMRDL